MTMADRAVMSRITVILLPLLLIVVCQGSCGYHLVGRGGAFPQGVRTVAVSTFRNRTDRYGLEGEASSVFVQEILATGKVLITGIEEADAWFEGVLNGYSSEPIAYNNEGDILERRVRIAATVEFYIKGEKEAFFSEKGLAGRAEYVLTGNLVEDSQAERDAESRALEDLAAKVISRIIEGF